MVNKHSLAVGVMAGLLSLGNTARAQDEATKTEDKPVVGKSEEVTTPVSLDVKNESIQDVLNLLFVQRPGASVLFDPQVSDRKVSLTLNKMPWSQAFKLVLKVARLSHEETSPNVFYIKPMAGVVDSGSDDMAVTLYSEKDIPLIQKPVLVRMLGRLLPADEALSADEMRDTMKASGKVFIKNLQVKDQPAIEVIKVLAETADLNFAFSNELITVAAPVPPQGGPQGGPVAPSIPRVSMNLKNMDLEKVLVMVAQKAGYSCIYKEGIWEVSPQAAAQLQPLLVSYFEVKFLPIDAHLIDILTGVVTERAKIKAGKNKFIVVKATETGIEAVRRTLQVMDKPTPQVMIEARFFELTNGDSEVLGLDWEGSLAGSIKTTGSTMSTEGLAGMDMLDSGILKSLGKATIVNDNEFVAILNMLYEDDKAQNLSNPKIVVASGQQATIHIGEKRPIIKSTVSGSGADKTITSELDTNFGSEKGSAVNLLEGEDRDDEKVAIVGTPGYLDLGTILTVAPTVKTAEEVYIKVVPNLTNEIGTLSAADGNTYPIIFSTIVQTEFTLRSGQTIAIGGLVKENESTKERKVPLMGDIPLLGYLFRYEEDILDRAESIIFLTVKIMNAKDLKTTSGIPVSSKLAQPVVDRIRKEDADGAEYIDILPPEVKKEKKLEKKEDVKANNKEIERALKDLKNEEFARQQQINKAVEGAGAAQEGVKVEGEVIIIE